MLARRDDDPALWLRLRISNDPSGSSHFELRARRLAYLSIGVPPFFVLTGVALGLLHWHVSDELVWVVGWLAVCFYVLLGSDSVLESVRPPTRLRVAHGIAAALVVSFVLFHLSNHLLGLVGPDVHAAVMRVGRRVYRSHVVEPILIGLLLFQVVSGARLAWRWSSLPGDAYRVFQIGSGAYLAAFILAHLNSALISARTVHKIDTDWAWASGAPVGLIHDAWNIRLLPHYAFGVFFVLAHLSSGLRGRHRTRREHHGRQSGVGSWPRRKRAGFSRNHQRSVRRAHLVIQPIIQPCTKLIERSPLCLHIYEIF